MAHFFSEIFQNSHAEFVLSTVFASASMGFALQRIVKWEAGCRIPWVKKVFSFFVSDTRTSALDVDLSALKKPIPNEQHHVTVVRQITSAGNPRSVSRRRMVQSDTVD